MAWKRLKERFRARSSRAIAESRRGLSVHLRASCSLFLYFTSILILHTIRRLLSHRGTRHRVRVAPDDEVSHRYFSGGSGAGRVGSGAGGGRVCTATAMGNPSLTTCSWPFDREYIGTNCGAALHCVHWCRGYAGRANPRSKRHASCASSSAWFAFFFPCAHKAHAVNGAPTPRNTEDQNPWLTYAPFPPSPSL